MPDALQAAEPFAGAMIYAVVLADLLLTVLYARLGGTGVARLGAGVLANAIGRSIRSVMTRLCAWVGHRSAVLSFCGPLTLLLLPFAWTFLLTLGAALVIHPRLGISIVVQQGQAATDFLTALYAAGTSMALTGSSEYIPATRAM